MPATLAPFRLYRKKQLAQMRPLVPGESLAGVSIAEADRAKGSPKAGDMIARNPASPDDLWLVEARFFEHNYELVKES